MGINMNKQKIKQIWKAFLEDDEQDVQDWKNGHAIYYRKPTTEDKLTLTNHRLLNLMGVVNQLVEEITADVDPCPGCKKGAVCRTPNCGRLKLPPDHPLRNQQ